MGSSLQSVYAGLIAGRGVDFPYGRTRTAVGGADSWKISGPRIYFITSGGDRSRKAVSFP
jgi:hypothetical protein